MRPSTSSNCQCYANSNLGPFGTEGATDGTSNTALISEKLIGLSQNGLALSSPNANRVLFSVSGVTFTADTGGGAQALQFYQACQSLPGSTTSVGSSLWNGRRVDRGARRHAAVQRLPPH